MVQLTRLEATQLRARAAMQAAAQTSGSQAKALHAAVARDAKKIAGEKMPWSTPLAQLLQAGLSARRGDQDGALALLSSAITSLDEAGMSLHAACARWQRGRLLGGEEGRQLVASSAAWMAERKVRRPERMAAMMVPGFPD
jgi:hypothetical protein